MSSSIYVYNDGIQHNTSSTVVSSVLTIINNNFNININDDNNDDKDTEISQTHHFIFMHGKSHTITPSL
jgi:hypothetical protein